MSAPTPAAAAGGPPRYRTGPHGFRVSVRTPAGSIMEPDPDAPGYVRPAAANSKHSLGTALAPGFPVGSGSDLYMVPQPATVAVARGMVGACSYAADAKFGDLLVAADGGLVTPAGGSADPSTIVGQCYDEDGVKAGESGWTWVK